MDPDDTDIVRTPTKAPPFSKMDIDSPPTDSYDDLPTHAGHSHLNLPHFSASFPLPFRVLTLVGLEILLWAINLHVLTSLGVDVGCALDLSEDESGVGADATTTDDIGSHPSIDGEKRPSVLFDGTEDLPQTSRIVRLNSPIPSNNPSSYRLPLRRTRRRTDLHPPIYTLFGVYTLWVALGWAGFRYLAGKGGEDEMDKSRWVIGVIVGGVVLGLTWRRGFLARSERMGLLR